MYTLHQLFESYKYIYTHSHIHTHAMTDWWRVLLPWWQFEAVPWRMALPAALRRGPCPLDPEAKSTECGPTRARRPADLKWCNCISAVLLDDISSH